ncbi:hypothetical protein HNR19_002116 [Nocardioides thalensis]|uniref:Uncharacterized protein n=1 Tax=Nocardioides thalensis TaxID=1914755 RepID=A0A853C4D5_9ACTN|nr:hypothetical protein [Nocardioides thalensis]NYJ01418.1 hypothetical protein [Nocardioides thalensis]
MTSEPSDGDQAPWPPSFPHLEIDQLIDRLENGRTLDSADAYRLLALVAQEAQRLRATAVRLATAKLSEADREARRIVADALGHADEMRDVGLTVLNTRLDEGERLLSTMREAFKVERRSSDLARSEERRSWAFSPLSDDEDDE